MRATVETPIGRMMMASDGEGLTELCLDCLLYTSCKLLKLPHDISAPAGMIGASNFFELSVAVAVALFGTTSPAALATTVGVLTEVPVMLTLVKIANKTKQSFR